MPRCTLAVPPSRLAPSSRRGANPSIHRRPALRRFGGLLALLALLTALPAPVLAAPAEDSSAGPGLVLLDWLQGFLALLGLKPVPVANMPEGPSSLHQRLGSEMEPNGVLSSGAEYDGPARENLSLGAEIEPNG